jgi:O-antigen/teichoic acid export membrane protein
MVNLRRTKSGTPGGDLTASEAPPAGKPGASVGRVVSLTVIDQGASSVSNFGLSVLVAHGSGAREIGVFAIVITTYILCQGLVRSVTSDCLLTRSGAEPELRARFERAGYLFAFVAACAMSLVVLAIAAVVGSSFAIPFVIFAISFPLMALQDFSRYIGISRHDPAYAIRLDVAWIVLFVVAVVGLRSDGLQSLPWLFGAWTSAGALVGLATIPKFLSVRWGLQNLRFWISSEWSVGTRFAGQFLVGTFGAYGVLYLLVFVISIDAIGLIKVTQLALAPVVVLFAGVQSALVSIVSRKMRENRHQATRFLQVGGVLMTLTMALWTVAVYVAPIKAVSDLFGPTWAAARPFMIWIGFATAVGSVSQAYLIGLRAMRSAKELLRLVIYMAPFLLVLPLGGAKIGGIRGMAIGSGAFSVIYAVISYVIFSRATRRFEAEEAAKPVSLADMLAAEGEPEPLALSDVLAREGLVAPISFAEMFAHHASAQPVSLADMVAGHNGSEPVSFADLLARQGKSGAEPPADGPTATNGSEPVTFAELLARQSEADPEPVSFAEMLARQPGLPPIPVVEKLARRDVTKPVTPADDGSPKSKR